MGTWLRFIMGILFERVLQKGDTYQTRAGVTRRHGNMAIIDGVLDKSKPKSAKEAVEAVLKEDKDVNVKSIQSRYYTWRKSQNAIAKGKEMNS